MNTYNSEFIRSKNTFSISSPTFSIPPQSLAMEMPTPTPKVLSPYETFLLDAEKDLFFMEQLNPTTGGESKFQEQEEYGMNDLISSLMQTEKPEEFEANPFVALLNNERPDPALNILFSDMDRESMNNTSKTLFANNSAYAPLEKEPQASSSKKESRKPAKKEKIATIAGLPAVDVDMSRTWSTEIKDPNFQSEVKIYTKTRKDEPSELFPDKIYASLKYELIMEASGDAIKDAKFLHSRAYVVYSDTKTLVEESNSIKYVLKGTTEGALTKSGDRFDGKLKVQISNNLSTHSAKREYCIEVHFYQSDNLDKPILVKRSPQFKAYARRPNKPPKRTSSERAAVEEESEQEDEPDVSEAVCLPQEKKIKSEYDQFVEKLEDLLALRNRLNEDDKMRASSLLLQQFPLFEQLFR